MCLATLMPIIITKLDFEHIWVMTHLMVEGQYFRLQYKSSDILDNNGRMKAI